jgi:hypothetical protein
MRSKKADQLEFMDRRIYGSLLDLSVGNSL